MSSNTSLRTIGMVLFAGLLSHPAQADFRYAPDDSSNTATAAMPVSRMPMASSPRASQQQMPVYGQKGLSAGEGEVISGFGKQVPLVLALREIVPTSYQFAYAPGLKLGALVDWKGGKPWHDVLNDVLAEKGLYASESNSVISIAGQ